MLTPTMRPTYGSLMSQQANANYQLFVSSFAYTIAADVLTTMVDDNHSMFLTALTLVTALVVLTWASSEIEAATNNTPKNKVDPSVRNGPLHMIKFVIITAQPVIVNFLSIAFGRWIVNMHAADAQLAVTLPTLTMGVALLYLLGASANFV